VRKEAKLEQYRKNEKLKNKVKNKTAVEGTASGSKLGEGQSKMRLLAQTSQSTLRAAHKLTKKKDLDNQKTPPGGKAAHQLIKEPDYFGRGREGERKQHSSTSDQHLVLDAEEEDFSEKGLKKKSEPWN